MKTPEEFRKEYIFKDKTLPRYSISDVEEIMQSYSDQCNKLLTLKLAEAEHAAKLNKEWAEGYEKQLKEQRREVDCGMTSDRIKEIQDGTAYPESQSVMLALNQVWNECQQGFNNLQPKKGEQEDDSRTDYHLQRIKDIQIHLKHKADVCNCDIISMDDSSLWYCTNCNKPLRKKGD